MFLNNQTAMNPPRLPYQRCLIPSIPENVQGIVRDVTTFVVTPLNILLASLSIISNSLVLTAVLRTRSLQHPSLLLLCSLSVTDVLYATYSIVQDIRLFTLEGFCDANPGALALAIVVLCYISTVGNLAIISRDRYLAVSKPWWYRNHVTRSRVVRQASFIWVLSLLLFGSMIARRNFPVIDGPARATTVLLFACFAIIIVVSYVGVFIANRRQRATVNQHGVQTVVMMRYEKKLANTVGLILVVLLFSYLPALMAPLAIVMLGFSTNEIFPFRPFYRVLITLNGLSNPVLNYGRNKDVRRAVGRLIRRPQSINRIQSSTTEGN